MVKRRTAAGVLWTDPTGREWLSPTRHAAPGLAVRRVPRLRLVDPDHDQPDDQDCSTDADPARFELRALDPFERTAAQVEAAQWRAEQRRVERIVHADEFGWGAALDDPTRWEHGSSSEPDGGWETVDAVRGRRP